MAFRDDRDAQLARSKALERELDEKTDALEQAESESATLEARLEHAQSRAKNAESKLAAIEKKNAPETSTTQKPAGTHGVMIGVGVLVLAGAAGALIFTTTAAKEPKEERGVTTKHSGYTGAVGFLKTRSEIPIGKNKLREALGRNRPGFESCVKAALARRPRLDYAPGLGIHEVEILLRAHKGRVIKALIKHPKSLAMFPLGKCLLRETKGLWLPSSDAQVNMRYTLRLVRR